MTTRNEKPNLDFSQKINASQIVIKLLEANPEILLISFLKYKTYQGVLQRIHSNKTTDQTPIKAVQEAAELKTNFDYPFNDSLMTLIMYRDAIPDDIIKQCLFHPTNPFDHFFDFIRNEVQEDNIRALTNQLNDNEAIGVSSKVHLSNGEIKHIPMLDFRCPVTPNNLKSIKIALGLVGQTDGYILHSGRSYHFYGLKLLDDNEWIKFMVRMLLLPSLIDSRYIAHRLIDGYTTLRLFSNKIKPFDPYVIDGPKLS